MIVVCKHPRARRYKVLNLYEATTKVAKDMPFVDSSQRDTSSKYKQQQQHMTC